MDDIERLSIVLKHLIEHNEGHVEDYQRWVELAKNNNLPHVAELISEANGHIGKASEALKIALDHIDKSSRRT
jgi:hypothetical protein